MRCPLTEIPSAIPKTRSSSESPWGQGVNLIEWCQPVFKSLLAWAVLIMSEGWLTGAVCCHPLRDRKSQTRHHRVHLQDKLCHDRLFCHLEATLSKDSSLIGCSAADTHHRWSSAPFDCSVFWSSLSPCFSTNIPLMRLVQTVHHTKRRPGGILREGWLLHHTSTDTLVRRTNTHPNALNMSCSSYFGMRHPKTVLKELLNWLWWTNCHGLELSKKLHKPHWAPYM